MLKSHHKAFAVALLLAVQLGRVAVSNTKDAKERRSLETITDGLEVSSMALSAHPCQEGQAIPPGAYIRSELITPDHPEWNAEEARRLGVDVFSKTEPIEAGEDVSPGESTESISEKGSKDDGEGEEPAGGANFSHIKH